MIRALSGPGHGPARLVFQRPLAAAANLNWRSDYKPALTQAVTAFLSDRTPESSELGRFKFGLAPEGPSAGVIALKLSREVNLDGHLHRMFCSLHLAVYFYGSNHEQR